MAAVAVLLAGCLKDGTEVPAVAESPQLVLSIPETDEVAVTRATMAECLINNLYVLVYRTGSLAYKQEFTGYALISNGTTSPVAPLNYRVQTGDVIYVVANYDSVVKYNLDGLGTGAAASGLSALLIYQNPLQTAKTLPMTGMPMFGTVTWSSSGSNICTMVRSLAKVTVTVANGLFMGQTLSYTLAGAPPKTSMEVREIAVGSGLYTIPGSGGYSGAWAGVWNWNTYPEDIVELETPLYSASFPNATTAAGLTFDRETFDKWRTGVILVADNGTKEYYRLDFSQQKASTTPTGDAGNEYMDIAPNTHYTFHITDVKSGGYSTIKEARDNPGSNIEYTVTISGNEWESSTSNGQYLIKTDREKAVVMSSIPTAEDLVKFAWQMPDAGQKPGSNPLNSVTTRVITLVGADRNTPVPTSQLQLCLEDGTPVQDNTFNFRETTILTTGYQLKYTSGSTLPTGATYVKIEFGNIVHYVPIMQSAFNVTIPVTQFRYNGKSGNILNVESYSRSANDYIPQPWTAEFSTDGGATWSKTLPSMLSSFPTGGAGSNPGDLTNYPVQYTFNVNAQTPIDLLPRHDAALKAASVVTGYDLSTNNGTKAQSTANSYIVNAAGTYSFPVVYGNAITGGRTYNAAYYGSTFKNHLGNAITNPYIRQNTGCTPYNAVVVWQDAPGLISNVALSGDNITFMVATSTIKQGNAIIAVRNSSGTILWSWHIWVTDYKPADDKVVTNYDGERFTFMPINLGWCYTREEQYDPRSIQVRITQTATGLSRTFTFDQRAFYIIDGDSPYYQWGRKDPLLPGVRSGTTLVDKPFYPGSYSYNTTTTLPTEPWGSILFPYSMYLRAPYPYDWIDYDWQSSSGYLDLWNASGTDPVVKTIYDPSPAGYCMPAQKAFTGFPKNGNYVSDSNGGISGINSSYTEAIDVSESFAWEFYCNKVTSSGETDPSGGTIYFPLTGIRDHNRTNGTLANANKGNFWTADLTMGANGATSTSIGFEISPTSAYVNTQRNGYRGYAMSVRPVREVIIRVE